MRNIEKCDSEKKRNVEIIAELKKQAKELHEEIGKSPSCDEEILKKSLKHPKETFILKHKSSETAVQILDDKVINLNKKLDLMHDYNKQRQNRMRLLVQEHEELRHKREMELATKRAFHGTNQVISSLENRTHQISMSMMEAEHLRKKYRTIRAGLMQDSVQFESSLDKLEQEIFKQEAEIKHLTHINEEALALRDSTRNLLTRQEQGAINTCRQRERQIQDLRFYVEERKTELEKLERRILPSGRRERPTSVMS
uniref:Coiled-coil domain-containing protein 151 n=4 Tax=Cacopsylla melanoneura TaxID=428564 RepID=A0A8D9BPD0_9HEMI